MRFLLSSLLLCCGFSSFAQLTGKVISIADGDTFTLLTQDKKQVKVRLHGIDCPENGQPFASVAQDFLGDHVFGKQVYVEVKDTDHFGRTIGIVFQQKQNINELLLGAGLAWHYRQYDKSIVYDRLEQDAKQARKGLWSQSGAVAPWEWRRNRRG